MDIDSTQNVNTVGGSGESKLLHYWKQEIRNAIRYRTVFAKSNKWKEYKNMYRGFWSNDTVPVNIIYSVARSLIPQIYFRNPRVGVSAKKPGYGMHARVLERIDNHIIGEIGLKNELKSSVLDNYLCGRGPIVIGYDTEYGFNPHFMSDLYEDSSLTTFNKKGQRIEYSDVVKPGMPWAKRCNPSDFLVPWGTNAWEDAQWFAFRKMRKLQDIMEDPKYSKKSHLKAPYKTKLGGSSEGTTAMAINILGEDAKAEWVELYQIHDKRTGNVFVLSLDHDKFLREDTDYLQQEGLPAVVTGYNQDPDYFWWTPDARIIYTQQLEINDVRTMARKHRRVALLKILADKNLPKDELSKLLDADPKAVARVDVGPQGDIRKMVTVMQSHVPPDFAMAAREIREDTREAVGFSRNQAGAFEAPSGRRTAHEAEIVRAASMIRIDERRDVMADAMVEIIRKHNQLIFEHWSTERVVDVVGDDGARYWIRFTGKEIKGEFNYNINAEESIPEDRRTRRQDAEKFMEIAANVEGINMKYLVESYAQQFGWIDPKLLFPAEGPGRNPEKAMDFYDFIRQGKGGSAFPGLGG